MTNSENQPRTSCGHQCNVDGYHKYMEPVAKELLTLFWNPNANFRGHVCCINNHMKRFREEGQAGVAQAVVTLGFNFLCCHYGDKLKKEIKQTELEKNNEETEHLLDSLKCYSDLKKNKLGSVCRQLEGVDQVICEGVPCESTAFYWRTRGSYHLHNYWGGRDETDVKELHKKRAIDSFEKSMESFQKLSERNPWCQYLLLLYVKSITTMIFLQLKLCWFLFDPLSLENRFDRHRPTNAGIREAEKLLRLVRQEIPKVEKGSIWENHSRYQLLVVEFFYHCRITQHRSDSKQPIEDPVGDIIIMSRDLKQNYNNGVNSEIIEKMAILAHQLHSKFEEVKRRDSTEPAPCKIYSQDTQQESDQTTALSDVDGLSESCCSYSQSEDGL